MTNEEKHKLLDAVIGANRDNIMGGKYYKAYESGVINAYNRLVEAIKALEQTDVLDKIIAKIERKAHSGQWSDATMYGMLKAVEIIDEYRKGGAE